MMIAYIPVYVSVVIPLIFRSEQGIWPEFGRSENKFHENETIVELSLVKQAEALASLRFAVEAFIKPCFAFLTSFLPLRLLIGS